MKIGILVTGHIPDEMVPEFQGYAHMFERLLSGQGFTFETWRVVDMEFPDTPTDVDGWLITGSRHGAYEDHPFIPPLEDFIRKAFDQDIPMVGICFGHQIIAQALGGKVIKYSDGWAIGRQTYDFDGQQIALNAWHQDQVVERPDTARVAASNEFCENAALIYGQTAYTVQAHPEFQGPFIQGLLTTRAPGLVPGDLIDAACAQMDLPIDDQKLAVQIGQFFKTRQV